jgi:hypothetical protein
VRSAVVVIALAAAAFGGLACTKRVEQAPDCATYVRCFLDDGGAGYQTLVERFKVSPGDPELRCYEGFVKADDIDDLDKLIEPMLRSFDDDGTCWAGGYSGEVSSPDDRPPTDVDLEQKYPRACEEQCKSELAANCRRSLENRVCADDDDVIAFCGDPDNVERIESAVCPEPPAVGEGEGE